MKKVCSHLIDTSGTVRVALPLFVARRFVDRLRGLLWREQMLDQAGLLLTPCTSVHTFGLTQPIDIVFLDHSNRIIGLRQQVFPGRICWSENARQVIELAGRQIRRDQIANGMFWHQLQARDERNGDY